MKDVRIDVFEIMNLILGPCENEISECRGTPCFMKSLQELKVQCTCLPKRSMTDDGRCYEPYTRGPCRYTSYFPNKISISLG